MPKLRFQAAVRRWRMLTGSEYPGSRGRTTSVYLIGRADDSESQGSFSS